MVKKGYRLVSVKKIKSFANFGVEVKEEERVC
mgnify:CR=1 FL=1